MASPEPKLTEQQWAIQRRLEDVFTKLGEKFGDLTGRAEVDARPGVPFDEIGGLRAAKATLRGFATALINPDLYRQWGITPPKGVLLYGPPGTGKSLLAKALATASEAIFYHLKLMNLTSKFGPNTGELLQEILAIGFKEGRAVVFLDEADALSLEHLLPPPQAREASARLVAALAEKLDALPEFSGVMVVAATNRTDAVDPSLVAPGRLDRLIEVPLPEGQAQQEILELRKAQTERNAGRPLFAALDYRSVLPPMGGMSGAEIAEIIRRALETKVHLAGTGKEAGLVTTQDLLQEIDGYKRIREVVEKIRYGQYL
ncbi:MAG: ATP-binding protein [Candidatus Rokubacteria bacterium]|nr:ATP-binding protein [Candidatus Rokubacteria bacterium]